MVQYSVFAEDGVPTDWYLVHFGSRAVGGAGLILTGATDYLRPDGIVVIEVGASADLLMGRYPDVPFLWLDFERGGDGVFLLTAEQLTEYRESFEESRE